MIPLTELVPAPYDFERSTFRFRRFGSDLANRWEADALHRVLASGVPVRIAADGVLAHGALSHRDVAELRHLLGAPFDVPGFAAAHPDVAARAPGFRPPLVADPFEALVTAVTAQQVSLLAACAIRNRLVQRFGRRVAVDGFEWWAFPRQEDLAGAGADDLTAVGLSRAKARSVHALAGADLDVTGLPDASIRARLTALPGIGGWTADWFLARCLARPDAFAAGDLGVRKAVARWFAGDPIWPEERVRAACARFGRHANLAVHYLLVPDAAGAGGAALTA